MLKGRVPELADFHLEVFSPFPIQHKDQIYAIVMKNKHPKTGVQLPGVVFKPPFAKSNSIFQLKFQTCSNHL